MPNVIDSLVVELGLDASKLTQGQRDAVQSFKKSQDALLKGGKDIEAAQKKVTDAFSATTRQALTFFAVLLGARGLKEFVTDITSADAALGRLSTNIGMSPQAVGAWENAAQRMGGSAEATAGTLSKLSSALYNFRTNGQDLPKEFWQLRSATGANMDPRQGLPAVLAQTAAAIQKLAQTDPTKAYNLAKGLGIDDGTYQVMVRFGAATEKYFKALSPTAADIKGAQDLQFAWFDLQQNVISLANNAMPQLDRILVPILKGMADWVSKNKEFIDAKIAEYVQQFVNWVQKIDWAGIKSGWDQFYNGAKSAIDAVGGIQNAVKILFGMWAGAQLAGVLAGVAKFASALAGIAASPVFSFVAGLGLISTTMSGGPIEQSYDDAKKQVANSPRLGSDGKLHDAPPGGWGDTPLKINGAPVSKYNPLPVAAPDSGTGLPFDGSATSASVGMGSWAGFGPGPAYSAPPSAYSGGGGSGGSTGGGSYGTKGWWTPEQQAHAYERLTKEGGLSDAGARALISRWMNVESAGGPGSVNPSNGAWGIAQLLGGRRSGFFAQYGQSKNVDDQLSYVIHELNTSEGRAATMLRNARTDAQGAVGASSYERAGGYNSRTGADAFTGQTLVGMGRVNTRSSTQTTKAFWLKPGAASSVVGSGAGTQKVASLSINVQQMHVHSKADNAGGIAKDIVGSLRRSANATLANTGLA